MGHIKIEGKRELQTPSEWLVVGRQIASFANSISERNDLIAYVGKGAGKGAPACYSPKSAEIEVSIEVAFGKGVEPSDVFDIDTNRKVQYEFPTATGAIYHEGFHAKYSLWNIENASKDLEREVFDALMLLEEGRIENFGVESIPNSLPFLKSVVLDLIIDEAETKFAENSNTNSAAFLVGLIYPRLQIGILNRKDVEGLTDLLESYLGLDAVNKLTQIIRKFIAHSDHGNAQELYPLAKEWVDVVNNVAKEKGDSQQGQKQEQEQISDFLSEIVSALGEAKERSKSSGKKELIDQEVSENNKDLVKEISKSTKEQNKNREIARKVFSSSSGGPIGKTNSRLMESRKPTADERSSAVIISQLLEKAKYRERDITEISSTLPQGRLRTRTLIQNAALKERGVLTTLPAWRKKTRKSTDEPTLSVGVMVDISGSMGFAMHPMASTAWIMSEAVRRVQGKCAMVYYGESVFSTLKVGQTLSEVKVYSAEDGTEEFLEAFCALDGSLDLFHGSGAKLLVIVSDGNYTNTQVNYAREILKKCQNNNVAVLWIGLGRAGGARSICENTNAELILCDDNPTGISKEIGVASAKALSRSANRAA
jgi:hypothetical protein